MTGRFSQNEILLSRRSRTHYTYASQNPISTVDPNGLYNGQIDVYLDGGGGGATENLPTTFSGFTGARYQKWDQLIADLVADFNANKTSYSGGTAAQAAAIPDLTPNLLKSWLIQETGGNRQSDLAAWEVDPVQVNVPGDWSNYKAQLGLSKPRQRNEGTIQQNLKASIGYLCRKGFGKSAQPAGNRPTGTFDDWKTALQRYGPPQDPGYAQRIIDRANDPTHYHKIEK